MAEVTVLCLFITVICVAVNTTVWTGMIYADVNTFHTAASAALVFIPTHTDRTADHRFDPGFFNTA